MNNFETLITGILAPSWFQIVEFSEFFIIPTLWCWKMTAKQKWSNFSKKFQYFWNIWIESSLIFCIKNIWSVRKRLDYQILEYLINLKLKCNVPSNPILLHQGHTQNWLVNMSSSFVKMSNSKFWRPGRWYFIS